MALYHEGDETRLIEDTLVRRYEVERTHVDGLPGEEGSFTACSFWYVECLARAGDLEKAQLLFEKLLGYANHLGLYSENGCEWPTSWQFSSSIHASGTDQRGNLSGPGALGDWGDSVALDPRKARRTSALGPVSDPGAVMAQGIESQTVGQGYVYQTRKPQSAAKHPGIAGEGQQRRTWGLTMCLATPSCVQKLQAASHGTSCVSFPRAGCGKSACPVR